MNNRNYMEQVVALVRECPVETGRAIPTPKVAALLVGSGLTQPVTCQRGQTASGDHAEFGLLVKKKGEWDGINPASSRLFVSLEPCTDRGPGKTPCATHVIQSGIKSICIGTLDPNPKIRGKGVRQLMENGIDVDFFDVDLAAELEEINRPFSEYIAAVHGMSQFGRGVMMQEGVRRIRSARRSVELYGGDISWASDYRDAIAEQVNAGVTVEVHYINSDKSHYNASILKDAGAKVNVLDKDLGLRLMWVDAEDEDRQTLFFAQKVETESASNEDVLGIEHEPYRGKLYDMHTDGLLLRTLRILLSEVSSAG